MHSQDYILIDAVVLIINEMTLLLCGSARTKSDSVIVYRRNLCLHVLKITDFVKSRKKYSN
jgi:hypothetical protein